MTVNPCQVGMNARGHIEHPGDALGNDCRESFLPFAGGMVAFATFKTESCCGEGYYFLHAGNGPTTDNRTMLQATSRLVAKWALQGCKH